MTNVLMKRMIIFTSILLTGFAIGWLSFWVYSYFPEKLPAEFDVSIEKLLMHSHVKIDEENYSCEGDGSRTVGAVIGSMIDSNLTHMRNRISQLCFESACGLIFDYCKPWQSQECGSRILRFDLNSDHVIDPASFVCIDAP